MIIWFFPKGILIFLSFDLVAWIDSVWGVLFVPWVEGFCWHIFTVLVKIFLESRELVVCRVWMWSFLLDMYLFVFGCDGVIFVHICIFLALIENLETILCPWLVLSIFSDVAASLLWSLVLNFWDLFAFVLFDFIQGIENWWAYKIVVELFLALVIYLSKCILIVWLIAFHVYRLLVVWFFFQYTIVVQPFSLCHFFGLSVGIE